MPILAGWLTGEQVPEETIKQTLVAMGTILGQHGGQPTHIVQPGAGLIAFSDTAYTMRHNDDTPVLDWVPDRRTFVYRRPLSGMHTLYYVENWPAEGNLLFASEIKALFAVGVPRRLHLAALNALLRYGFIPAPWTAFKHIHVVPAGWILRWQRAKTVLNQSSDYHFDEPPAQHHILNHLQTLLNEAIEQMLPPHEQLVALTGGDHASALSAILSTHRTTTPFTIASLGYMKSKVSKRWKNAEQIATIGKHPFLAITSVDLPDFWLATVAGLEAPCVTSRPLALHQLLHTVAAETGARVAISGLGTHVLLGSIVREQAMPACTTQSDILDEYSRLLTTPSAKKKPLLWSHDAALSLQEEEPWEQSLHARKLVRRATQFTDKLQGYYYLDLHLRLPDLLVHITQQLATQERMVVRSPYLHTSLIDVLTRLPAILDNGMPKIALISQLVQRYLPDQQTLQSTLPLITPTASLLRVGDSALLQQTLSTEALRKTGIFDLQVVDKLLKQEKEKNKEDVSRELLFIFTTQILYHLFGVET